MFSLQSSQYSACHILGAQNTSAVSSWEARGSNLGQAALYGECGSPTGLGGGREGGKEEWGSCVQVCVNLGDRARSLADTVVGCEP